jgi:hypothetical protein
VIAPESIATRLFAEVRSALAIPGSCGGQLDSRRCGELSPKFTLGNRAAKLCVDANLLDAPAKLEGVVA